MVTCPQCQAVSEYSVENRFRPFCSERCKLIDLGLWADEGYRIAQPIEPDEFLEE
ncbi:conserved hypothetical protein [Methylovorus sp. MP688]|nr:conserved hypothetical protein [Methylovorus sp. MP688]